MPCVSNATDRIWHLLNRTTSEPVGVSCNGHQMRKYKESAPLLEEAVEGLREVWGAAHPHPKTFAENLQRLRKATQERAQRSR